MRRHRLGQLLSTDLEDVVSFCFKSLREPQGGKGIRSGKLQWSTYVGNNGRGETWRGTGWLTRKVLCGCEACESREGDKCELHDA